MTSRPGARLGSRGPSPRGLRSLPDQLRVPTKRTLRHALLRRVVDIDEAEARCIAGIPLEIVEQGPHEIAADARSRLHRGTHRVSMGSQILDALLVADLPRLVRLFARSEAVLRDKDRQMKTVMKGEQRVAKCNGINRPSDSGALFLGRRLGQPKTQLRARI